MKLSSGCRCPGEGEGEARQQGAEIQDELPAEPRLGGRVAATQLHSKQRSKLLMDTRGTHRELSCSYAAPPGHSCKRTLQGARIVFFQILPSLYQCIFRILKFHLSTVIITIQFLRHRKHTTFRYKILGK
jgi:hypothetical protein